MAKKNYYAVKKGKTPGIYRTWDACKAQVEGYPGAVYKGFAAEDEAKRYMGEDRVSSIDCQNLPAGEALAYVDGSYNVETGEYSCGVVFFFGGEELHLSRKGDNEEMAAMRNVAGEIMGARMAMEEALRQGAMRLTIVHDYQGVASWCTGEWKANKEGTKAYKTFFDSLQGVLTVQFRKVKGHSGDAYNDLADKLAKSVIFDLPVRRNTSGN